MLSSLICQLMLCLGSTILSRPLVGWLPHWNLVDFGALSIGMVAIEPLVTVHKSSMYDRVLVIAGFCFAFKVCSWTASHISIAWMVLLTVDLLLWHNLFSFWVLETWPAEQSFHQIGLCIARRRISLSKTMRLEIGRRDFVNSRDQIERSTSAYASDIPLLKRDIHKKKECRKSSSSKRN